MSAFTYEARDANGREVRGSIDAIDATDATARLRADGLLVFALDAGRGASPDRTEARPRPEGAPSILGPSRVDVEVSLRQLGVMLRSGLTLLEGIRTVAGQTPSRRLRQIWLDAADRIQSGSTLHDAMERHRAFGRLVTRLVEVGEQTGELDGILIRASEALERRRMMRMRLINALLYPSVVFVAALGATIFMLTFAIPRLTTYLQSSGSDLPRMTAILVDVSTFLRVQWPTLAIVLTACAIALAIAYSTRVGRLAIDRALLRVPLLGYMLRVSITASLSHALSIMIRSGITIVESLRTVETLHANRHVRGVLERARLAVVHGDPLAPALSIPGALMPMLGSMVAVGEQSGTLDLVLEETAEFHEHRLTSLIGLLSTVVEIAVVVVVGVIVGFVYIAFMLALYKAATP